jgi:hypothetical protein
MLIALETREDYFGIKVSCSEVLDVELQVVSGYLQLLFELLHLRSVRGKDLEVTALSPRRLASSTAPARSSIS